MQPIYSPTSPRGSDASPYEGRDDVYSPASPKHDRIRHVDTTTLTAAVGANPTSPPRVQNRRHQKKRALRQSAHIASSELIVADSTERLGATTDRQQKMRSTETLKSTSERLTDDGTEKTDRTSELNSTEMVLKSNIPRLLLGTNEKTCPLKPGKWLMIGRDQKSHLWLNNSGVSRYHCRLRWDRGTSHIEFQDSSTQGTLINEEIVKQTTCQLFAGDQIKIRGKENDYEMKIDFPALGKDTDTATEGLKRNPLIKQRNDLKREVKDLDVQLEAKGKEAFLLEKKWYELMVERQQQVAEMKAGEVEIRKLQQDCKEMEAVLEETRVQKMVEVDAILGENSEKYGTMRQHVQEQLKQLEKLKMLRDEILRKLNPKAYGTMETTDLPPSPGDAPPSPPSPGLNTTALADSDDDADMGSIRALLDRSKLKREAEEEKKIDPMVEKQKESSSSSSSSSDSEEEPGDVSTPISAASSFSEDENVEDVAPAKKQRTG